ncbi:MAG TPA: hypothetical protein VGF86_00120 [Candidatus Tumulicola sp.]|jgi:hypothetical protein
MTERPAASSLYDWSMAVASLWLSAGILIDAWYHFHETVESFFEPAHALLFAGLLASYVFTAAAITAYVRQGYPLRRALPPGYDLTRVGLVTALAGGILDMIKHTLWGFEQGFDALLSPTHLLIGAGMFLIILGPIRSAFMRTPPLRSLAGQLPMLFAVASMMELIHWGTQFIFLSGAESMNAPVPPASMPHDTLTLLSIQYDKQGLGLLSVFVQSALTIGFSLFVSRRFRLAPGALVVMLVVGNAFIAAVHASYPGQFWAVILASAAAGVCGEIFAVGAHASAARWNAFSFFVPAVYWAVFLSVLAITMQGLWWSHDVVAGSVLFAGLTGLFVNAVASSAIPIGASPSR